MPGTLGLENLAGLGVDGASGAGIASDLRVRQEMQANGMNIGADACDIGASAGDESPKRVEFSKMLAASMDQVNQNQL